VAVAARCSLWHAALPDAARLARSAALAALAALEPRLSGESELSIVLADDALVRSLNQRWRGRDAPTNVLSFASGEAGAEGRPRLLGDVVLAYETVARES